MGNENTLVGAVKTEQGVELKGMLMQPSWRSVKAVIAFAALMAKISAAAIPALPANGLTGAVILRPISRRNPASPPRSTR